MDLKVYLLAEDSRCAGNLEYRLDTKLTELESVKKDLDSKESVLKEKRRDSGRLEAEQEAVQAAIGGKESDFYDSAELICTGYTSPMRVQAWSYRNRLNIVLGDVQACEEYLCRFRVCVAEDGHSLYLGKKDSN